VLATPFAVSTNWHVLTGAACSGKTTLIDMLAAKGFATAPESAREYLKAEVAKGRSFADIFGNPDDEPIMARLQMRLERELRPRRLIFLDRALPDCLTFYRFCGLDPNEILADCRQRRYASVFILDRLPFCQDDIRLDDDPTADLLDAWLARDYRALGYAVVRVPVLPPEPRLAFILDALCAQRLM
jgi:predicted ATPase